MERARLILDRNILAFTIVLGMLLSMALGQEEEMNELKTGLEYAEQHNWGEALKHFAEAIQQDSSSSSAWANHGTALLNLGRPDEAIKSYERARQLNGQDPYIHCSLASAHIELKHPQQAVEYTNNALAIDSLCAPALANKAKALELIGRSEEAEELYKKAFQLDPDLEKYFK